MNPEAAKQILQRVAQHRATRRAARHAAFRAGAQAISQHRRSGKKGGQLLSAIAQTAVSAGVQALGWSGVVTIGVVVVLVFAGAVAAMFIGGVIALAFATSDYEAGLGLVILDDVPDVAADAYIRAAEAARADLGCNMPAAVLAAVGYVESGHGGGRLGNAGIAEPPIYGPPLDGSNGVMLIEDTDGGDLDDDIIYDRAVGPMQFIPQTWYGLGRDGDGDGTADPQNVYDATSSAAWYLCDGRALDLTDGPTLAERLLHYNRSTEYVATVMGHVGRYRMMTAALGTPTATAEGLLNTSGFSASPAARDDLRSGNVEPRLVEMLAVLTASWRIHVGVIHTGHSRCIARTDCVESHHWHWRAADITLVADRPDYDHLLAQTRRGFRAATPAAPSAVSYDNTTARGLVEALAALPVGSAIRPHEVGSPWPQFSSLDGFFSDEDHLYHIHLAVCGPRSVNGTVRDSCD